MDDSDVLAKLAKLEDEFQENLKQERKVLSAIRGIGKQISQLKTLQGTRDDFNKTEEELQEYAKQEKKLCGAMGWKRRQMKMLKDSQRTLSEQISDFKTKSGDLRRELNMSLDNIRLTNQDKCSQILQKVLTLVVDNMKIANSLFRRMYKCTVYTGSYYEKLRIKDAGEFDLDLVLDLPIDPDFIEVDANNTPPYATLRLRKRVEEFVLDQDEADDLRYFLDDHLYVLPGQMLHWFQGVVDKARLTDVMVEGVKKVCLSSSGPARTLLITLNDSEGTKISVDLVPVFRFPYERWPAGMKGLRVSAVASTLMEHRNLYLVPKLYKTGSKQSPHEPAQRNIPRIWRMHFADIEKSVLKDVSGARSVIKLLKLLRDSQKWDSLCSYCLKTLVMNEVADNPEKDWGDSFLAERLLEMLTKLRQSLEDSMLPHFFFTTVNLFQYIETEQRESISQRLEKIRLNIALNPSLVKTYFKTEEN